MLSNNPFSPLPPPSTPSPGYRSPPSTPIRPLRSALLPRVATAAPSPPFSPTSHREHPFRDPPLQPTPLSYFCIRPLAIEAYATLCLPSQPRYSRDSHPLRGFLPPRTHKHCHPLPLSVRPSVCILRAARHSPLSFVFSLSLSLSHSVSPLGSTFVFFSFSLGSRAHETRPLTLCLLRIIKFLHT